MAHKRQTKPHRCDMIAANIRTKDVVEASRQLAARSELLLARRSRDPILRAFAEREAATCSRLSDALISAVGTQP